MEYNHFYIALQFVFNIEGHYSNDIDDPGGETKYGISKRQYPNLDIARLNEADALQIYRDDYWLKFHCHVLPGPIAILLFDAAVQHKPKTAVRLIQQPIHSIKHDGVIGPQTILALSDCDIGAFVPQHLSHRSDFYKDLVVAKSSNAKFHRGWQRRLFLLQSWLHIKRLLPDRVVF